MKKLVIDSNGVDSLIFEDDYGWLDVNIYYNDRDFMASVDINREQVKRIHEFLGEWLDEQSA